MALHHFQDCADPVSLSTGEIEQLIRTHAEARGVATAKTHSIVPLCFMLAPDVPPPGNTSLRPMWMLGVARRLGLVPWPDGEVRSRPAKGEVDFYRTRAWRLLRYKTLLRYGAKCIICGATAKSSGEPLHVDHIKPRSKFPELALDPENVVPACASCNAGKSNWDSTDWRPSSGSSEAHPRALPAPDSPSQKAP